jgi:hypothetical protein
MVAVLAVSMIGLVALPSTAGAFTPGTYVWSVQPSYGPLAGGTTVDIEGHGFTGATAVDFGTTAATSFTVLSDDEISAVSPASTTNGTVDVTVTTAGGTSVAHHHDQFLYGVPAPCVRSVQPSYGPLAGGTTVDIEGHGFTGATAVDFGTTAATSFTVLSDDEISAVSPASTTNGTVDVTVTTAGGSSVAHHHDQFLYGDGSGDGWSQGQGDGWHHRGH